MCFTRPAISNLADSYDKSRYETSSSVIVKASRDNHWLSPGDSRSVARTLVQKGTHSSADGSTAEHDVRPHKGGMRLTRPELQPQSLPYDFAPKRGEVIQDVSSHRRTHFAAAS